ncbi:MAG: alpha/beta hydrolase [Planctomycetota bacterium]|nr:MAG: alpha/beta hydrolase [Planctomycetota bacterium]
MKQSRRRRLSDAWRLSRWRLPDDELSVSQAASLLSQGGHAFLSGADSCRLWVRSLPGQGEPIIYLHGIADWGQSLLPLAMEMGYPALIPDLRGHGFSQRQASYRVLDYAADIVALLDALGQRVTLYGHSLGALVSLVCARTRPQLVRHLILEDPPLFHLSASIDSRPSLVAAFSATRQLLAYQDDPHQLLCALLAAEPQRDPAALARRAEACRRYDPTIWDTALDNRLCEGLPKPHSWWQQPACPCICFAADPERNPALQTSDFPIVYALHPQAQIHTIHGSGHSIHGSYRQQLIEILKPALDQAAQIKSG